MMFVPFSSPLIHTLMLGREATAIPHLCTGTGKTQIQRLVALLPRSFYLVYQTVRLRHTLHPRKFGCSPF